MDYKKNMGIRKYGGAFAKQHYPLNCKQKQRRGIWESASSAPLRVESFVTRRKMTFPVEIALHFSTILKGTLSIEIRCCEYTPLTRCCQHWFPFLPEIWCWNPLQADKYLYTRLPDLIAFLPSGLDWSPSQCTPHHIVFFYFCSPHRALI